MGTRRFRAHAVTTAFLVITCSTSWLSAQTPLVPPPPVPSDFDGDGDVDADDLAIFNQARTGPCIPLVTNDPLLRRADFDGDGDVDQDDFGYFQTAYTGARPPSREDPVYYVAPNGNDSWSGLLPEPSPGGNDGPFRTPQRAAGMAQPGARIVLRGGYYDIGQSMIAFARSGEPDAPITFTGMPGEMVELRAAGSKPVFDFSTAWGNNTAGFGWFIFRNFKISGGRYGWWISPPYPADWNPAQHSLDALLVDQIHDITIEDVEVDGNGTVESAIYVRNAGVRNLVVRRCRFHHTVGTEGTVDIGEWKDVHPAHAIPRSCSRNLVFEDCEFYETQHQQANGVVTQPCVHNVTFVRCRAFNNGKYGFACKGSGEFRLNRCAAWGNSSSQMYCRGFGGDSGEPRPPYLNAFLITNSIFIAPADQRGGSALNWRENTNLNLYNCTIVGLRDGSYGEGGGYSFLTGNDPAISSTADVRNCIIVGFTNSNAMRFASSSKLPYLQNVRYIGDDNLFYADSTPFKYMARNWQQLSQWQEYWATGEPNGDDGLNGPRATFADAHSIFANPLFVGMLPQAAPRVREWMPDLFDPLNAADVRLLPNSPAIGRGQNMSHVPELRTDYLGNSRPSTGAWTLGAVQ